MFHIFANLRVLALSQKHGDDQILHDFTTTYEICIRVNNFTVYNTYSGMRDAWVRPNDWDEYTLQSESKKDYGTWHANTSDIQSNDKQDRQEPIFTHMVHPASSGSRHITFE